MGREVAVPSLYGCVEEDSCTEGVRCRVPSAVRGVVLWSKRGTVGACRNVVRAEAA